MNEMTVFDYKETPVRTIQKDTETWWVLADVCKVLEIKNASKAATQLDDDERSNFQLGRQGTAWIINEPGLYSLILRSNKPEAKAFKRWVTHEVLPTIRKTGSYHAADKSEIAEMIVSCKTAAAVKGILALYNVQSATPDFHVPQNANNSVTLFLSGEPAVDGQAQKEVYKAYKMFCIARDLVPSTLANFSKEIHKQTGLIVKRIRIDGKLTSFYRRG